MFLLTFNAKHNECLWIPVGGGALSLAWQLPLLYNAFDHSQGLQVNGLLSTFTTPLVNVMRKIFFGTTGHYRCTERDLCMLADLQRTRVRRTSSPILLQCGLLRVFSFFPAIKNKAF